jgi:hypothetical protein
MPGPEKEGSAICTLAPEPVVCDCVQEGGSGPCEEDALFV